MRLTQQKLKQLIAAVEPALTEQEKTDMWNAIRQDRRLHSRFRRWMKRHSVAACIALFLLASFSCGYLWWRSDESARLLQHTDMAALQHTTLFVGKQQIELGHNIRVVCLPDQEQIEICQSDVSFRISGAGNGSGWIRLAVPEGEKAEVQLADRSLLILRGNTKLAFPFRFDGGKRDVRMEGEAYVKVTPDSQSPFETYTPSINVRVLGTEFLLSAYPGCDEQSVTLVKGLVEVIPEHGEQVRLQPNQTYTYRKSGRSTCINSEPDIESLIAWKEDVLILQDEPLNQLIERIEKHYGTTLDCDTPELADIRLNGKLDISIPLDDFLKRLSKIAPIDIKKENNRYIIIKR